MKGLGQLRSLGNLMGSFVNAIFMELGKLSSQRSREVTGLRVGDENGATVSCQAC